MVKTVCRICLSTSFIRTEAVHDKLVELHDELCDYDVLHCDAAMQFCSVCEYLLQKFYKFKQRCRLAHEILKTKKKLGLENLHKLLPPSPIGFGTSSDNQAIIKIPCDDIKFNINDDLHLNSSEISTEIKIEAQVHDPILITDNSEDYTQHGFATKNYKQDNYISTFVKQSNDQNVLIENGLMPLQNGIMTLQNGLKTLQNDVLTENEVVIFEDYDDCDIITISNDLMTSQNVLQDTFDVSTDSDDEKILKISDKKSKKAVKTKLNEQILEVTDILSVKELELLKNTPLNETLKEEIRISKRIMKFITRVTGMLDDGRLELGGDVTMTKDSFLEMFNKCDKSQIHRRGVLKTGPGSMAKIKKFLLYLLKHYNPKYETMFDVEYLATRAQKVAEFESRKLTVEYQNAELKCHVCYKVFELEGLLEYHKKWHDETREHACSICSMRFDSVKQRNTHQRSTHSRLYRCKLCPTTTYIFEVMKNHYQAHLGKKYSCEVCLGEYSSMSSLNTHRLVHATHACPHCARSLVSKKGLHRHIQIKHPEATSDSPEHVSRDKCDAALESRDLLRRHARLDHNQQSFRCLRRGCWLRFESGRELRAHAAGAGHVRRVPAVRRPAPRCGPRPAAPRRSPGRAPYRTCSVCEKQVANTAPNALYVHHTTEHPELPYMQALKDLLCELCGKTFIHISIYRDHMNTHTGAKPYECTSCKARFHMRRALMVHRQRHLPPKYECKDCGKMFLTSANLFIHRRTHIGDRRYKCDICFKGFLHPGSVKEHINGVHQQIRRLKKTTKTRK